jgi:mono/diheme cytochrome c family protein
MTMPAPGLHTLAIAAALIAVMGLPTSSAQQTGVPGNGRALYKSTGCGSCHGAEGQGTAAGPSLAAGPLPLTDFIAFVRQPTGTMPGYRAEDISEEDLTAIYAFLEPLAADTIPSAGRVDVGAMLYRKTGCYACHADEAQGGAQGPRLGPNPVTFAMFGWYTRHPTGGMPPYTSVVLSDQDLADIYAFVEARPQPPPVASIPLLVP